MAHRVPPGNLLALKLVLLCRRHGVDRLPDLPARALAAELTPDEVRIALDIVRAMIAQDAADEVVARFEDVLRTPDAGGTGSG